MGSDQSLFSLPITRGFTRLSTIYWSFFGDGDKRTMYFRHPLNGSDPNTDADMFSWNITVGADRYPVFDCDSVAESFYRLRLASLMHHGTDAFSISGHQYRKDKFIGAANLEKAPGQSSHSGVNTRQGSQVTLNFKNIGTSVKYVHIVLHYDVVVSVSAAGAELLD